jgi:hypothetical protein
MIYTKKKGGLVNMQTIESISKVDLIGGQVVEPKVQYVKSDHHTYNINGEKVVGASTIAGRCPEGKNALARWANKMGLKGISTGAFLIHSANVGTIAHKNVECNLAVMSETRIGEIIEEKYSAHVNYDFYLGYAAICYNKFLEWLKDHPSFKLIFTEKILISYKYGYGGQIDIYGDLNGRKILVDIKTSNSIYKSHRLQVGGGYYNLLKENYYPVDDVYILRIGRDENDPYQFNKVRNVDKLFNEFKKLI